MPKLLNRERETLIAAIMADVPKVDYPAQITKVVQEAALALCPLAVRRLWADQDTRDWLETTYLHLPGSLPSVTIPAPRSYDDSRAYAAKVRNDPKVAELCDGFEEQEERLLNLRSELTANLNTCVNHDVFRKRFPDLAGYLPELTKVTPTAMLPSTTALMDHLKVAGLPLPKELDISEEAA